LEKKSSKIYFFLRNKKIYDLKQGIGGVGRPRKSKKKERKVPKGKRSGK